MKKAFTIIIVLLGATLWAKAQSQNFHAFKFDFGVGAFPFTNTLSQANFSLEPHYRIKDNLAYGLRYQYADAGDGGESTKVVSGNLATYTYVSNITYQSICITGDHYLSTGAIQTFVGGGAGFYIQAEKGDQNTASIAPPYYYNYQTINNHTAKPGLFARVGLEVFHFRTSFEFDLTNGLYNYLSLNVGYFLGGGEKQTK